MYPSGVLPDLRGEFVRGWDDGRGVNPGRVLLSSEVGSVESHSHQVSQSSANKLAGSATPYATPDTSGGLGGPVITSSYGGTETRPRNIAFNYIVRAI